MRHRSADAADLPGTIAFTVWGEAVPQGSAKAFVPKGWSRPIITSDNPHLKSWRQLVAEGASHALQERPASERRILTGAVRLTLAFYFPRPKKFQRGGIHPAHLTRPDLDKCGRAIFDALTKVLFLDDSQVVELVAVKRYVKLDEAPHVDIRVEPTAGVLAVPRDQPLFEAVR